MFGIYGGRNGPRSGGAGRSDRAGSGSQYGGAQGIYAFTPTARTGGVAGGADPNDPRSGRGGTLGGGRGDPGDTSGGLGDPGEGGYHPHDAGPTTGTTDPVYTPPPGPTNVIPGGGSVGIGQVVLGGDGGGSAPAPLQGASSAWRAANDARVAAARSRYNALPQDQKAGFRTDAQGARYYYQPGMTPAQENNPVNKAWAYGLANPSGMFAERQFAQEGQAPVRAIPAYTAPGTGGADDASPALQSVVDTPSTHPYTAPGREVPTYLPPNYGGPPPVLGGGGGGGPAGGGAVAPAAAPRYFPVGQSTPGYGGASTPLQIVGAGPGAGSPGAKPAGAPGFDPATAPTSAQAKQQGASYQARQSTSQRQMQTNQALAQPGGANPYNRRYTAANPYQPTPARY